MPRQYRALQIFIRVVKNADRSTIANENKSQTMATYTQLHNFGYGSPMDAIVVCITLHSHTRNVSHPTYYNNLRTQMVILTVLTFVARCRAEYLLFQLQFYLLITTYAYTDSIEFVEGGCERNSFFFVFFFGWKREGERKRGQSSEREEEEQKRLKNILREKKK